MRTRRMRRAGGIALVAGLVVVMAAQSAGIVRAATSTPAAAAADWPTFQIGSFTGKDHTNTSIHGGEGSSLQIAVYGFHFGVISPRDPASGLPTGRRRYQQVEVTKPIDASTPRLLQALTTNENLKNLTISVYRPGTTTTYLKYVLTNANVATISHDGEGLAETVPLEQDSFTFQKICVDYLPAAGGGARIPAFETCDDWSTPPA